MKEGASGSHNGSPRFVMPTSNELRLVGCLLRAQKNTLISREIAPPGGIEVGESKVALPCGPGLRGAFALDDIADAAGFACATSQLTRVPPARSSSYWRIESRTRCTGRTRLDCRRATRAASLNFALLSRAIAPPGGIEVGESKVALPMWAWISRCGGGATTRSERAWA